MTRTLRTAAVTRRDVLRVLGIGAGAGLIPVLSDHRSADAGLLQATPPRISSIPRGAVIRTILRDLSPNAFGNGAILFHEHLSFGGSFFERMRPANAPRPATPPAPSYLENPDLVIEEVRIAGGFGGVDLDLPPGERLRT